jgi:2-aminoadipate transaminase
MCSLIDSELGDFVKYVKPEGGLFIWCTLPESVDTSLFIKIAAERNVRVVPGATFNCDTNDPSRSFRLNFSTPSDEQIISGIKTLGELTREMTEK